MTIGDQNQVKQTPLHNTMCLTFILEEIEIHEGKFSCFCVSLLWVFKSKNRLVSSQGIFIELQHTQYY